MKLDVNNNDWEDLEESLPPKQKIVKKKTKDFEVDKELKSKKSDNYRKVRKQGEKNENIR